MNCPYSILAPFFPGECFNAIPPPPQKKTCWFADADQWSSQSRELGLPETQDKHWRAAGNNWDFAKELELTDTSPLLQGSQWPQNQLFERFNVSVKQERIKPSSSFYFTSGILSQSQLEWQEKGGQETRTPPCPLPSSTPVLSCLGLCITCLLPGSSTLAQAPEVKGEEQEGPFSLACLLLPSCKDDAIYILLLYNSDRMAEQYHYNITIYCKA